MQPPGFVASYSTPYSGATNTKTVSVTTAPGDVVVVYSGSSDAGGVMSTPTGNSITFTLQQNVLVTNYVPSYIWSGTDTTGGTSWTMSITRTGGTNDWGYSCLVFRSSTGIGASSKTNAASGASSLSLTTTKDNSAIVVFDGDWNSGDGSGRVWRTVNGITPTSSNGLERDYLNTPGYTIYGAYYNDAGTAGAKTVGLSTPATQKYAIVALEVFGSVSSAPIMWVTYS